MVYYMMWIIAIVSTSVIIVNLMGCSTDNNKGIALLKKCSPQYYGDCKEEWGD